MVINLDNVSNADSSDVIRTFRISTGFLISGKIYVELFSKFTLRRSRDSQHNLRNGVVLRWNKKLLMCILLSRKGSRLVLKIVVVINIQGCPSSGASRGDWTVRLRRWSEKAKNTSERRPCEERSCAPVANYPTICLGKSSGLPWWTCSSMSTRGRAMHLSPTYVFGVRTALDP